MQKVFSVVLVAFIAFAGEMRAQTFTLTQTFPNPTPANADQFGNAVAAVGNKILVGTRNDDTKANNAGAVYLFDATNSTPPLEILNPNSAAVAASDLFGSSVAAFGSDLLVGAPGANGGFGEAYLFNGTTGALIATFLNPNPSSTTDEFGLAVAAVGNNILIGAPGFRVGVANNVGAAYLFDANGNLLGNFCNPTPATSDRFGVAVAAVGNNVVIGASGANSNSGEAYLFNGTGTMCNPLSPAPALRTFMNPGTPASRFGGSVAAVGANVLIGAACGDTPTTNDNAGIAYLFDVNIVPPIRTFANPTPANLDQFSFSLAAFGNSFLAVIGAPLDNTTDAGAAYLYDVNITSPLATLQSQAPATGDQFGFAIAASGNNIIISANNKRVDGFSNAGEVYLFSSNAPPVANAGADQNVECASLVTLDGSGSSDPNGDPLTYTWLVNGNTIAGQTINVTLALGMHTIVLTVDDGKGGTDTDEVSINVMDTTPPLITLNGDKTMTLECHVDSYTEPGAVVSDACDQSPSLDPPSGSVNPDVVGTYTITYTATDDDGNSALATRTVKVVDTTPPVIMLNGDNTMTLECHVDSYSEPGFSVSDACDQSPSPNNPSGSVNPNVVGNYTITYTAVDDEWNNASATRTVNVVDTTPPDITLNPSISLWPPNHKYVTISMSQCVASVSDACAGSISLSEVTIVSASSDEPQDASDGVCQINDPLHVCFHGDGSTINDLVIAGDCKSVQLRSERAASGNGRVYTINLQVSDASGNVAPAAFKVSVPHDQGSGSVAVENLPYYTVASNCASSIKVAGNSGGDEELDIAAPVLPQGYAVFQNYPNPFWSGATSPALSGGNPGTEIRFALPEASRVTVKIFNTLGETVRTLADRDFAAGLHALRWNAQNERGEIVPSGMYFYQLVTPSFTETKRMILSK